MPNYDPDVTPSGLSLINTGNIPYDPAADGIRKTADKINSNTFLLEERSQRLAVLETALAQLLTGNPVFTGLTDTNHLVVQKTSTFKGDVLFSANLRSAGLATFDSDVTFERVVYSNGLLLVQDPDARDNSSRVANTRWVRAEVSRTVEALQGLTLDDLEDYAQLSGSTFTGPLRAPTPALTLGPTDDVATLSYTQRYLTNQLKNYATNKDAQLEAARVTTPPADALDDLVVNAFWVDEFVSTKIGALSTQLTTVGVSITNFQQEIDALTQLTADTATSALIGSIVIASRSLPEPGWLEANGAAVSETLYPLYYSQVGQNFANPASPPPAGMFALPNWSAEVSRLRTLTAIPAGAPLKAFVYVGPPSA